MEIWSRRGSHKCSGNTQYPKECCAVSDTGTCVCVCVCVINEATCTVMTQSIKVGSCSGNKADASKWTLSREQHVGMVL